jgi:NitT/TauT family transport system ATP-binding protein
MVEAATKELATPSKTVLDLQHIHQAFARPNGTSTVVLDDISFSLREGEIVGVLGRSGCGKSTLLRIAAGLLRPTSGQAVYQGAVVDRPAKGIAMVFQTFALFPWLTVFENVMAGLDALGVKEDEANKKALAAIDMIGLDGFESAYPRELSGGMRQRVGFARALVVDPVILMMDEPFSALDVLTAETLRSDFIDLWSGGKLAIKSTMLVTHNIEEAVFLADRIIVLAPDPGRIAAEIEVALPRPRDRLAPEFRAIVDDIYARMTAGHAVAADGKDKSELAGVGMRLPFVSGHRIVGLLELLAAAPFNEKADLRALAQRLHIDVDLLLPATEAVQILGFAEMRDGLLHLSAAGKIFVQNSADDRKRLFAEHLLRNVPLAAHIRHVLSDRPDHAAPRQRFSPELEDHLSAHDAEQTLATAINWGRYAEIYEYDQRRHCFTLTPEVTKTPVAQSPVSSPSAPAKP